MKNDCSGTEFENILRSCKPGAIACIRGNAQYPQLCGALKFFSTPYVGVLVTAEIYGLPNMDTPDSSDFYAMHIHEAGDCTPPFSKTGAHYNPTEKPHPYHAGDMLPLMGNQGFAWLAFYDERFTIPDIIGRSVIIHKMADDFTTQPSGNAGEKIACGVICSV